MSDSVIENGKGGAAPLPVSYNNSEVRDWIALLKPRVMSLVVFTGLAGMVVAPGALHPLQFVLTLLCISLASGAGAAIAPFAILGAVVGLIVRLIAERRLESPADAAPTPTH